MTFEEWTLESRTRRECCESVAFVSIWYTHHNSGARLDMPMSVAAASGLPFYTFLFSVGTQNPKSGVEDRGIKIMRRAPCDRGSPPGTPG